MQIAIVAPGSRGDIQPYLALAKSFAAGGHGVRLVTTRDHAALAREHGVEPWLADIDVRTELERAESRAAIEGGSLLRSFRQFARLAARGADLLADQVLAASSDADAVLTGFAGLFTAASVAEKLGLPLIQAYNVPFTPTTSFPGVLTPWLSFPPRSITHPLGHLISREAVWITARVSGNSSRRKLGLPSAPWLARFDAGVLGSSDIFYGLSPSVFGRPPGWGGRVHMLGFWFLDAPASWRPPPELEAFLASGPKPVYVGFGSMSSRDPAATARLVVEAIRQAGQRAVVQAGWGGMAVAEVPDTVMAIDPIPHSWLFPRMSAIIHHGGAGTTAAAIRAGVPSIVVPFHGDQPFWGGLVEQLGVGPHPVRRTRLTPARLARAVTLAIADVRMQERARVLGERVRSEDGVRATVAAIEQLVL